MEKTWKPTTAGILLLIAGAFRVLYVIVITIIGIITGGFSMYFGSTAYYDGFFSVVPFEITLLAGFSLVVIVTAVFEIRGGVFALQRRKWGWALAGSIISICGGFFPLGVLATIFVAMGKGEFGQASLGAAPAEQAPLQSLT